MGRISIRFNDYIYSLLLEIRAYTISYINPLADNIFKHQKKNPFYNIFQAQSDDTPTAGFEPATFRCIFDIYLSEFDYWEDWEDFHGKETSRWISYGKPGKDNFNDLIKIVITELDSHYKEKTGQVDNNTLAELNFSKVENYERKYQYDKAIELCMQCVRLNPESYVYTFKLAELSIHTGDADTAIQEIENLSKKVRSEEFRVIIANNAALSFRALSYFHHQNQRQELLKVALEILQENFQKVKTSHRLLNLNLLVKLGSNLATLLLELKRVDEAVSIINYLSDYSAGKCISDTAIELRFRLSKTIITLSGDEKQQQLQLLLHEVKEETRIGNVDEFTHEVGRHLAACATTKSEKFTILKNCFNQKSNEFQLFGNNFSDLAYCNILDLGEIAFHLNELNVAKECFEKVVACSFRDCKLNCVRSY